MNQLQLQNYFSEVQTLQTTSSFINQPIMLCPAFKNSSFFFAVSEAYIPDSKINEQIDSLNFQTRIQPSIIIQSSSLISQKIVLKKQASFRKKRPQTIPKKPIQKESRNVSSNLMRIFFKNVIELKYYDDTIQKIIELSNLKIGRQQFYEWLDTFNINFKNYIKFAELKRICNGSSRNDMHSIVRILFRRYVNGVGIRHILTSKRIEKNSIKMHLLGLRNLPLEIKKYD